MQKEKLKEKLAFYENKTDSNSLFVLEKLRFIIGNIEKHEAYIGKEVYPFTDREFYHDKKNKIKDFPYLEKVFYTQELHNSFLNSYKLRFIKHLEKRSKNSITVALNELEGVKELINFLKEL